MPCFQVSDVPVSTTMLFSMARPGAWPIVIATPEPKVTRFRLTVILRKYVLSEPAALKLMPSHPPSELVAVSMMLFSMLRPLY